MRGLQLDERDLSVCRSRGAPLELHKKKLTNNGDYCHGAAAVRLKCGKKSHGMDLHNGQKKNAIGRALSERV